MARCEMENLSGVKIRLAYLTGTRFRSVDMDNVVMHGVEFVDVDIYGEIGKVTINGVDARVAARVG